MKKLLIITLVLIVSILFSINYSYALDLLTPSAGPYMTDNDTTVPDSNRSLFWWNETPYNFTQFNTIDLGKTLTLHWTWKYGDELIWDGGYSISDLSYTTPYVNKWLALDNWETLKNGRAGSWSVFTTWSTPGKISGSQTVNFDLNANPIPEPNSFILFMLGGIALSVIYIRRNKKILA